MQPLCTGVVPSVAQTSPVCFRERGERWRVPVANPILAVPGAAQAPRARMGLGCLRVALWKQ